MPKTASGRGSGFVDQGAGSVSKKARRNDLPLAGMGFGHQKPRRVQNPASPHRKVSLVISRRVCSSGIR